MFREALSRTPWETVFLSNYEIDEVCMGEMDFSFRDVSASCDIHQKTEKEKSSPLDKWRNSQAVRRKRPLWKVAKCNGSPLAWSKYKKLKELVEV